MCSEVTVELQNPAKALNTFAKAFASKLSRGELCCVGANTFV